eukprot:TRINITY_DN16533_c0_g1_i1.p1 TRINITY_DN16533_c0_g1~~TRINITY_DN16533_c0_g1_i1.p1  ORF type:complete len:410 (+),score=100.71 TRINITY_DN16533_c0_g1_i1:54-1232(+)
MDVKRATDSKNGHQLALLLQIPSPESIHLHVAACFDASTSELSMLLQDFSEELGEFLKHYLQSLSRIRYGRLVEAYNELQVAVGSFLQAFRNWEGPWAMEALHRLIFDLRTVAEKADVEMARQGKLPDRLKAAGPMLMKAFGQLAGRGPKRGGALYVANQLFKLYFKLGNLNLTKSIIRSIETGKGISEFPVRDQVTFQYYSGRLEVFNDNLNEANERLTYALERCDWSKQGNIRKILKYLVPVRLSLGLLPTNDLLSRFQLHEYQEVVQAMRSGDVRLLRSALQKHEGRFLRAGVYLILEKLELHVFRRLIKKMHLIQKQKDPSRGHQVKMDGIVHAFKWMELDIDMDEVECLTATMIHKGFIKGYFSHRSKVVVLSKQDPFPKFSAKPGA